MRTDLNYVVSSLYYTADMADKPEFYLYEPPEGTLPRTPQRDYHEMPIYDSRAILEELSLDKQGFTLKHYDSKVSDFYNEEEVKKIYYPEIEQFVKEVTGASKVQAFDYNLRCASKAEPGVNKIQKPVKFAHNDYTELSGPQRLKDLVDPEEADRALKQRYAVINVWKPIRGPVQEMPLAVCDAQSMSMEDFIATDLKYEYRTGEIYSVGFNPNHQWFYFPAMQPNEVMLLKCFDSVDDGRARFTAHTAFKDPSSPPNAASRESIEVRTLVFFD